MRRHYKLELANDLEAIEPAVQYLIERASAAGFEDERLRLNFRVGVSEALANAMLNGNMSDPRKRVWLEAELSSMAIVVRVTDEGSGFDPRRLPDPTLPANRRRVGGRGIFLIRKLMDQVEFNDRGNSITMRLLNQPAESRGTGS